MKRRTCSTLLVVLPSAVTMSGPMATGTRATSDGYVDSFNVDTIESPPSGYHVITCSAGADYAPDVGTLIAYLYIDSQLVDSGWQSGQNPRVQLMAYVDWAPYQRDVSCEVYGGGSASGSIPAMPE
jgi:hypothetical protein